ncbi:cation:proton antiporter [Rubellimicrobium roseum]|uniref:Potassium transporter n=1 Tax=Rubellimicrobium roseum TaxID=687525 RepID=A0A5C4NB50_9RHOB|nr:cation:proton antiporter [Rubellimicrobium roseum]TNC70861.1 potassium transporter [Rubellimicrobium roseum]
MDNLLLQAAIYLGTAVLAVPLAARLGLGSVLGFLGAGLLIGPVLGLVGSESEDLRHFGEYGIAVMLFLVGLEVSPRALWELRHRLLGLGGLQVLLTTAAFAGCSLWLGHPWPTALTLGMVLALSSTAIVVQTLTEKGLLDTEGGRSGFSVLLLQDIAVIPMLAVLPLLAARAVQPDHDSLSVVEGLPAWATTLLILGAVGAVILTGTFLTRPVFRWIGHARLREIDTALALFIVVSIMVLMELVGLSPALGTFLAGVVLAGSEFRHELESDLQPFKGLLLGLFFIGIGAGVNADRLLENPAAFLAMTLAVIGIKAAILLVLAVLFRLRRRDRWIFSLGLAQAGEFGFVLVAYAATLGAIGGEMAERLYLIIALTMLVTPLLFLVVQRVLHERDAAPAPPDPIDTRHPVILAGVGRFGRTVDRLLRSAGQDAVLLDNDMASIERMRALGRRAFLGDPTRPEVLESAGLVAARVLVVALDNPDSTTRVVAAARRRRPDLRIVARAQDSTHAHALVHAGADEVLREVFDSALRAGRHVLEGLGVEPQEAAEIENAFAGHDRAALHELGELWQPGLPIEENEAYLARARAFHEDLEAAITERRSRPPNG